MVFLAERRALFGAEPLDLAGFFGVVSLPLAAAGAFFGLLLAK